MSTEARTAGARRSVVVVEIGHDWLKMMQAERSGKGVAISRLHLERVSEDDPNLHQALAAAWKEMGLGRQSVVACVPRQMVTMRILKLPSSDPAEIADMVDLQIGKLTPYSREEILSDYWIVGSEPSGYSRVLLTIVQRAVVRHRVNVLEEAGLDVESVCVTSEGVLQWMREAGLDPANGRGAMIVDIDSFCTDVMATVNGSVVLSRSVRIGANQLGDSRAEWIDRFASEIKRSLDAARSETPGLEFDRVFVSGAGPALDGLSADLAARLGLPVEPADCIEFAKRLPKSPSLRDPAYRNVSITPLIGVALAPGQMQFDLIPESVSMRKRLIERSRLLTVFGSMLMAVLVSCSLLATLKLFFREAELARLRTDQERTSEAVRELTRKHEVIKMVRRGQDQRLAGVNLVAEVHRLKPAEVYLDRVEFDAERGRVSVAGTSPSLADVRAFANELERSGLFQDVKPGNATLDPGGRYVFQMVGALENKL